jgi:VIT1/CCC1 family predicted Fe2+/Mn2+ transporter
MKTVEIATVASSLAMTTKKGDVVMNKEELLKKAQAENNGKDYADIEAQKSGTRAAYFIAVFLVIIVDLVNGFVLGYVNRGMDFVLFTMAFVAFLTKYIKLRKRHELFVAIWWGLLALMMLVLWILQLCRVIA